MTAFRRAGQNIRSLALRRRLQAISSFVSAGIVLCLPLALQWSYGKTFQRLQELESPGSNQPPPLEVSPPIYGVFVVLALALVFNGIYLWRRARRADQGARGEEEMAQALTELSQAGWQIEYGLWLTGGGDADIVCLSPSGQAYVIDVKSHRGTVITKGQQLYRRFGRQVYPFEKDFLERCLQQAMQVQQQKHWSLVTPILAFSQAQVQVKAGRVRGVYVVEKQRLVPLLRSLES